ncbi:unnamed protein product [Dicrocoelium dendriticum]|nr:unnamed protein product [Dicrocoelium dendriticum]
MFHCDHFAPFLSMCLKSLSGRLPWLDLQNIIQHLDRLRNVIKEHADAVSEQDMELQPLAPHDSPVQHPKDSADPVQPTNPTPDQ